MAEGTFLAPSPRTGTAPKGGGSSRRLGKMKRKESFLTLLKPGSSSQRESLTQPLPATTTMPEHPYAAAYRNKSLWLSAGSSWDDFAKEALSSSSTDEDDESECYWDESWVEDEHEAANKRQWEEEERRREEEWMVRHEERKRKETHAFETWSRRWDARWEAQKKRRTIRRTVALGRGVIEALGINVSGSSENHQSRRYRSRDEVATSRMSTLRVSKEESKVSPRDSQSMRQRSKSSETLCGDEKEKDKDEISIRSVGKQEKPKERLRSNVSAAAANQHVAVSLKTLIADEEIDDEEEQWAKEVKDAEKRIEMTNLRVEKEAHQKRERFLRRRASLTSSEKLSLFDEYFQNEAQIWRSRDTRLTNSGKLRTDETKRDLIRSTESDSKPCNPDPLATQNLESTSPRGTSPEGKTKKKAKKDLQGDGKAPKQERNRRKDKGSEENEEERERNVSIHLSRNQVLYLEELRKSTESTGGSPRENTVKDETKVKEKEKEGEDVEVVKDKEEDGMQHLSPRDRQMDLQRRQEMEERALLLRKLGKTEEHLETPRAKERISPREKGKKKEKRDDSGSGSRYTRQRSVSVVDSPTKNRGSTRSAEKEARKKRKKRWSLGSSRKSATLDIVSSSSSSSINEEKSPRSSITIRNLFLSREHSRDKMGSSKGSSSSSSDRSDGKDKVRREKKEKREKEKSLKRSKKQKKSREKEAGQEEPRSRYAHRRSASMNALMGVLSNRKTAAGH